MSSAKLISVNVPASVPAGQPFTATVMMQNTGTDPWNGNAPNPYRLGSVKDDPTWGIGRVELPGTIPPGGTAIFTINAVAPSAPGPHVFAWRMVHEGLNWFGEASHSPVDVTGSGPTPTPTPGPSLRVPSPGYSATAIVAFPRQPEVPLPGVTQTITNTTGKTLGITQIVMWTGVDIGGVCDTTIHVRHVQTGEILALYAQDHYAAFSAPDMDRTEINPPCEWKDGDSLIVTCFGAPAIHTQHTAVIRYRAGN